MKAIAKFFLMLPLSCLLAAAQTPAAPAQAAPSGPTANPVTTTVRQSLARQSKNLIAAAEAMPAEKYSYKPTPEQMTYGALIAHTAEANNTLCSAFSGQAARATAKAEEKDGKDKIVAALKASFDFCNSVLANADDSNLGDSVALFGGRKGPRASALFFLTGTWSSHYSMAAMHLRLNRILPPTAQAQR